MANRILVAEDEAIIALDLKEKLEAIGYAVVDVAASGEAACALAETHRPDLVLMDIMMPGDMDGADAARRIRETLDIPTVYLTAYATGAVIDRAKAAGAYGYIIKPYSEHQLKAAIEVALTNSRLGRALRASEARYRAMVESSEDFILRFTPDHRLVFSNRSFQQWAAAEPGDDDPEHHWHRGFPTVDRYLRSQSARISDEGATLACSATIEDANGRPRHYNWEIKGVFDNGRLSEYQMVGHDVTPYKRIQTELCDINTELEDIIRERDEEINELQFQLVEAETVSNVLMRRLQPHSEEAAQHHQIAGQLAAYIERMRSSKRITGLLEKMEDVGITVNTLPEATIPEPDNIGDRLKQLTPIELEVANLIRDGLRSKDIADQLCVSIRTVETHRLNIRKKLGLCKATTNLRQFLASEC